MTKDELLRLAVEVMEGADVVDCDMRDAITAIKAALEAKDEPVACKECHLKDTVYDLLDDLKVANLKLSVRSQRTWVGLTDEEQQQAYEQWQNDGWGVFYNAIEAKLKEKNT